MNGLEAKSRSGDKAVGKVKCKEQVNEALRQYFDKGKVLCLRGPGFLF